MVELKEVLEFLEVWRTRDDLRNKFNMSNTESFRYLRWLKKAKIIRENMQNIPGHQNKVYVYKKLR